ncbi:hypothetical protein SLA2020_375120 [Shorea laevis]
MEEFGSMWYQESVDELKVKLQYATTELEAMKMNANEQLRKHREDIKYLLNVLRIAYKERDEARDQLQKLLNKFMASSPTELHHVLPHPQPGSPLLIQAKANSSITESNSMNSLSDTYNHPSHGSSPVNSFFEGVTSPEFSSINRTDSSNMGHVNQPLVQGYKTSMSSGFVSAGVTKNDPALAVIDALAKGKTLPEKGKFLQAVMEAGPLLQTLLVAGPLPRWRNPPPLLPFKLPPFSIKGCDAANVNHDQKPAPNPMTIPQKPLNSPYLQMSRAHPHLCSTSMLNFSSSVPTAGLSTSRLTAGAAVSTQIPTVKRQKIQ